MMDITINKNQNIVRILHIFFGPLLFFLIIFILPNNIFLSFSSKAAIGTVLWMSYWWISAPVDYAVTALLPIAINAVFPIVPMSEIVQNYSSEIILLLLGASILTVSWEETGLDKRISAKFLCLIGPTVKSQIIFWFLLSTMLSMILPNSVVCATITPIAVSMLKYIGEGNIEKSKIGSLILMSIAWGAGVGGIATPLGGAMNLVTVDYLQQLTGQEYIYVNWIIRFAPITIASITATLIYLLIISPKEYSFNGSKEYFIEMYDKMPNIEKNELICLLLFVMAALLSFTRQLYSGILPGLKPAYIFIISAIITFLPHKQDGSRLMNWKNVQNKVIWGLLYIFAGGLALGTMINNSGAAKEIGDLVAELGLTGGFITVLIIITVTLILSDVTSNTATAAISIPLVISIVQGLDLNPIPYVYITSIGVNISYSLPTSIRAIPVGFGMSPKFMFKKGIIISIIVIPLLSIISYLLLEYWSTFSLT